MASIRISTRHLLARSRAPAVQHSNPIIRPTFVYTSHSATPKAAASGLSKGVDASNITKDRTEKSTKGKEDYYAAVKKDADKQGDVTDPQTEGSAAGQAEGARGGRTAEGAQSQAPGHARFNEKKGTPGPTVGESDAKGKVSIFCVIFAVGASELYPPSLLAREFERMQLVATCQ